MPYSNEHGALVDVASQCKESWVSTQSHTLASRQGERDHNAYQCTYIARRAAHVHNRKSPTSSDCDPMAKKSKDPSATVTRVAQRLPAPRGKRSLSEPLVDMHVGEAPHILTALEPFA